jgi:hypothetical protein
MSDNMRIWNAVQKTDPAHTKRVNQRGGFTAIDAHYQIMSATSQFGPLGEGWGYDTGAPIFEGGAIIIPVTLWHGERSNTFGPIYGCAEMTGKRLDTDAPKKATTDAITKGLSQLGFNADVFLGRFDDNKYVAELKAEKRNEQPKANPYALNMSDHSAASFTKAVCDMLKGKGQMEGAKVLAQNDHAISQLSDEMQDEIAHAAQVEGVDVKARKVNA